MKKLGHFKYKSLFLSHVEGFLLSFLNESALKGSHLISVSGGVDSMALLFVAWKFSRENKIGPIRALFIHHQSRPGQDEEQKMVEKFCQEKGIELILRSVQWTQNSSGNFEEMARIKRKEISREVLGQGELIWQGHHLDDSYEWQLMQKGKSYELKTSLGIPVRNKKIIRPFLCVSKNHIRTFARLENIPFLEDPTNKDIAYERNYLRERVIPLIKERYPNYLRTYVSQSNELARLLGSSILTSLSSKKIHYPEADLFFGEVFVKKDLLESIQHFSKVKRGELSQQVEKMQKAILNKKKGPFFFSGDVMAYFSGGSLLIFPRDFKNNDEKMSALINQISNGDINSSHSLSSLDKSFKKLLSLKEAPQFMPFLALVMEPSNIQKNFNCSSFDSLFPEVSEICREKGWRFVSIPKCLEIWRKKEKRLPKTLRIIPLYELSHLFSFQE